MLVIVPHKQAAQNLKLQYAAWQIAGGNNTWPTPSIRSWPAWIQNCWQEYAELHDDQRIVLSPWQQRLVWIDVIRSDINQRQNFLWHQNSSVSQAIKAWQLCHEYELKPKTWKHVNGDVEVFRHWYQRYSSILQTNNWLDPAQLINIMVASRYRVDIDKLIFIDQKITPNQKKWIGHIQSVNKNTVEFLQAQSKPKTDFKVQTYASFEEEIKACAYWAREKIKQNPNQTIGIVVPGLKKQGKSVLTTFRSVFTPGFNLAEDEIEVFELITINSVKQTGFINSALNCLELLQAKFDYECFSLLLRDVFLQGRLERRHAYSLLDVELRRLTQPEESLSNLIWLCRHADLTESLADQILLTQLEKLREIQDALPKHASAATWCNTFSTILTLLGWPELSKLNSYEQQLLAQWNQILAQMCTGGLVKKHFSLTQALTQLNELAEITLIQQSQQAPIRIIDLEDISQAYFDKAWVSGLTDAVLPAKTQLSPLLPFYLQRKHEMPFCHAESCLGQAQSMFVDIANLSNKLRFSYFKHDELSDFRVSPLISNLTIVDGKPASESEFKRTPDLKLEQYQDDSGLLLDTDSVSGGTYLLKMQSACPFQAYAAYRLKAEPLQSSQPGLDAAQKGILIHDVLYRIWLELSTQQVLKSLPEDELVDLVDRNIGACLKRLDISQQLFSQIEKLRLAELVINWLEIERLREIPFRVLKQEHKSLFNVSSINIEIKIDRFDELEDGRCIIIDYKSGNADSNQWIKDIDRIEDPQLPIYFLAEKENASAIAFASLKDLKFDGLADGDTGVNGIADINNTNKKFLKQHQITDWDELVQHWQVSVEGLIQEFIQGVASVTPRDPESQCKYCRRYSLCRLYQQQDFVGESDVAD